MNQPISINPIVISALTAALLGSVSVRAADDGFCRSYAYKAIEDFAEAQKQGCRGLSFPVWSMDFDHHYQWCRSVSESEVASGGELRAEVLLRCRPASDQSSGTVTGITAAIDTDQIAGSARHYVCTTYANKAIAQQAQNEAMHCGFQGPEWNANSDDHHRWCMSVDDQKLLQDGHDLRQGALDQCSASRISGAAARPLENQDGVTASILLPILDPGVGGRIPNNVDLQNVAQRAVSPPSRATMVNSLLAHPATRAQFHAIPSLGGVSPQTLAHQTLGGTADAGYVMGAVSGAGGNHADGGMSSSSGQKLPKGSDWTAGIQFSPFSPSPTYFVGGMGRRLGFVDVFGVLVSNDTAERMHQQKVVFLGPGAAARLVVDFPNETATYTVAFGLSSGLAQVTPDWYTGPQAPIKAYAVVGGMPTPLTLAPLSTNGGFVAMFTLQKDMQNTDVVATTQFMVSAESGFGLVFGGFTVTKL